MSVVGSQKRVDDMLTNDVVPPVTLSQRHARTVSIQRNFMGEMRILTLQVQRTANHLKSRPTHKALILIIRWVNVTNVALNGRMDVRHSPDNLVGTRQRRSILTTAVMKILLVLLEVNTGDIVTSIQLQPYADLQVTRESGASINVW